MLKPKFKKNLSEFWKFLKPFAKPLGLIGIGIPERTFCAPLEVTLYGIILQGHNLQKGVSNF
jgi:hypothetical protein